ncbi:MAG TPA: hypothetical protein VD794_03275 [Flavisolibacter sp.]|nr:hypothetical protein [Flavisolibacter sp.]
MKRGKRWFSMSTMNNLFWYHMFFAGVYYVMTLSSRSDSVSYYLKPQYLDSWFEAYATGTKFIEFLGYPFINYLMFTYEMMMVLFAWVGYWGFVYFYIFFKENIKYKHTFQGYDLITLFIFLPNMHYWTASLGKGAPIFLSIAMVVYGLSNLKYRKQTLIWGLLLMYHVRPHIFLFMALGIVVGLFTGRQKVPFYQKFLVFAGSAAAVVLMYDQIISFVGLDSQNLLESFDQFSNKRSFELAKANSGIDTSNYPLLLKLFTFWFRPLFVDAPGPVGLIVSFENLLYVFLAFKLFSGRFLKFMSKSSALVKTSAVVFLATSFALGETLSNMGIIIRQKSMVMYFLLFIIISFLDYKKEIRMQRKLRVMEFKKIKEQEDLQLIQA